ncbi:MAG: MFS transporter [Pseudomonadales bacterium]|jgi:predicted MFS family arabinose efflux permease|nr:MFS transporter [Pseudomonadales bacterium]
MKSPRQAEASQQARGYTLMMLVVVFASSHLDRNIMGILAEPIRLELGLTDGQLGAMTGFAFAAFYATLGMPMALWADRHNRRNLIALSIALWSAMTAFGGLAQNYWQLLIARVGVGVGEAGSNPPSHSIIADLYAPHERATAMGIFGTGVSIGVLLGFLVGGWINQLVGWREAFLIVGLPGLIIALLVRFTVAEPHRGASEGLVADGLASPFPETLRFLLADRVLPLVMLGSACCAFVGYALVLWLPAFFVRTHGLGTGQIGTMFALIAGLFGAMGVYATGRMADALATRGEGWRMRILALGLLCAAPLLLVTVSAASPWLAFAAFTIPAIAGAFQVGPCFALIQTRTPLDKRAVAASVNLFITNIVGLGVGPLYVGLVSDALAPSVGAASLAWGLASLVFVYAFGVAVFLLAAARIDEETAAVPGAP